jgi:hypothetical protein
MNTDNTNAPQANIKPPYSAGAKRTSTTVFAIVVLVLGSIGFLLSTLNFVLVMVGPQALANSKIPGGAMMIDAILQLACKIGLLSIGIMMIKRNILAIRVAIVTFLISLVSTAYTLLVIAPYTVESLGKGQPTMVYVGMGFMSILAAGLYIGIIIYLNAASTRAEFANSTPGYRF